MRLRVEERQVLKVMHERGPAEILHVRWRELPLLSADPRPPMQDFPRRATDRPRVNRASESSVAITDFWGAVRPCGYSQTVFLDMVVCREGPRARTIEHSTTEVREHDPEAAQVRISGARCQYEVCWFDVGVNDMSTVYVAARSQRRLEKSAAT